MKGTPRCSAAQRTAVRGAVAISMYMVHSEDVRQLGYDKLHEAFEKQAMTR